MKERRPLGPYEWALIVAVAHRPIGRYFAAQGAITESCHER
jgi:hypothetical protein